MTLYSGLCDNCYHGPYWHKNSGCEYSDELVDRCGCSEYITLPGKLIHDKRQGWIISDSRGGFYCTGGRWSHHPEDAHIFKSYREAWTQYADLYGAEAKAEGQ